MVESTPLLERNNSARPHQTFIIILLLYVALATAYSIVVPIGRGADEWAHYWYAEFIAEQGRLPASASERDAAGYKSDWPPLYHLFAAGVTVWVETEGPPTLKYRADDIRRHLVPAFGPDAILHTEDQAFPWRQEILIWHLGRFLSILFTAGTIAVTYLIARDVFNSIAKKSAPQLALIVVAVLAFNPRFLFTGMLFNYDSLTLLLSSLFLWLGWQVVKDQVYGWTFWGLGGVAGLALVTKYLAAPLPLIIVVLAIISARRKTGVAGLIPVARLTLKPLIQAALAFVTVISWWFAYLIATFNEIDQYGAVLGTLAPLIRGDGSDRTVEAIFAWLSGGQAPPPAYLEKQVYSTWEIIAEFPLTFWGNPINRATYPLNWFILLMTIVSLLAVMGLIVSWRNAQSSSPTRLTIFLLGLYTLLPTPFMLMRLFGARDALEAVQGRHILFLAGPATMILLVLGLFVLSNKLFSSPRVVSLGGYGLVGILLSGAFAQLLFMRGVYPPLLPVQTTSVSSETVSKLPEPVILPNGSTVEAYHIEMRDGALEVIFVWQGGTTPELEDYQTELTLLDDEKTVRSSWLAYQTQARYPTRAWEAGDVIYDRGWLPLVDVPAGLYKIRWRLLTMQGDVLTEQIVQTYSVEATQSVTEDSPAAWQNGTSMPPIPIFSERETIQIIHPADLETIQLLGPDQTIYTPTLSGSTWANFIVDPTWPAGEYQLAGTNEPFVRIAKSHRSFEMPLIEVPLEADFSDQIKLIGYHLPSRRVDAGSGIPVTLYWQSLDWMGEEFVIFDRLLDNRQAVWGGYDRLPLENYSTLLWVPGEIITDGFAVPVAPDAPDGIYTLNLGWYRKADGQSLPLINLETGDVTETTSVTLGPIKVGGPPDGVTVEQAFPQIELNTVLGDKIELLGFD
ncbi:MAG: glycosyltransferase family 39 protein, partial [Chloroflexota bacterium]